MIIVFGIGVGVVYLSWQILPSDGEALPFKIPPRGVDDAKALGRYLGESVLQSVLPRNVSHSTNPKTDRYDISSHLSLFHPHPGQYSDYHFLRVIFVYLVTYIFLQTFAIPGSIFLSIIAGALFSFPLALFLVCLSAAVGASNASLISSYIGKGLVEWAFPERIASWRLVVSKQQGNLLNYMIFLRITPIVGRLFSVEKSASL